MLKQNWKLDRVKRLFFCLDQVIYNGVYQTIKKIRRWDIAFICEGC
ncbi:unnamed protein product [Paramecium sonneborni]|uniref:Uncharacterized protein n=1 Tax=Paramecium sonneborni TaxID=65129 RepID=A0A8S1Q4F3_9CILI|nr:unnamed protein product [Paramecium sonneborni]